MNKVFKVETASYKNRRVKLTNGERSEWINFPADLDLRELRYGKEYEFTFRKSLIEGKTEIASFKEVVNK